MARARTWIGLLVIAGLAVYGGRLAGERMERLGPIGSISAPMNDVILVGAIAAAVAGCCVAILWRRGDEAVGIGACVAVLATMLGVYSAFDTTAGSRDCPGSQDCDTLIVPMLFPPFIAAALAAGAVGLLTLFAVRLVATRSRGTPGRPRRTRGSR